MEQISSWEAAILAAGITTVYNADDWHRIAERGAQAEDAAPDDGAPPQH